jgi:hypothetical protein
MPYLVAFLLFLQAPPTATDLAAMLSDGNRQARESIRTISLVAHHHVIPIPGKPPQIPDSDEDQERQYSVRWLQSGETFRSSGKERDGRTLEQLEKDGIKKSLFAFPQRDGSVTHAGALSPAGGHFLYSIWKDALFGTAEKRSVPLYELLQSKQLRTIESTTDAAHNTLYKVVIDESKSRWEVWFSPKYNFLVTKLGYYYGPDQTLAIEREATLFQEAQRGVYFPKRVIVRETWNDNSYVTEEITFDQVKINATIDSRAFTLRMPAGTTVHDNLRGLTYISDENEEPQQRKTGPLPPNSSTPIDFPTGHPARARFYFTPLAVGASALLTCSFLIYWIIRRRLHGLRAKT